MSPESQLSPATLERAIWSGREIGWRAADIRDALADARDHQLAMLGGQVQFVLPGGTCELYWHNFDSSPRQPGEAWPDYVSRTHAEVALALDHLPGPAALVRDGLHHFAFLREQVADGASLDEHLVYVCYFADEEGTSE